MAVRELTEHPLGLTWVGDDSLKRAAHALVHDGRVWLVDPFEDEEALARVAELGELAGVCSCSSPTSATAKRSRSASARRSCRCPTTSRTRR